MMQSTEKNEDTEEGIFEEDNYSDSDIYVPSNDEDSSDSHSDDDFEIEVRNEIEQVLADATQKKKFVEKDIIPNSIPQVVEACSEETKWKKEHCCYYCKKNIIKLARHLEARHKNEKDVKEFLKLKKSSKERRYLIDKIRKKGNFYNNMNNVHKDKEKLIVKRRPQKIDKKKSEYIPCPTCLGFYYKTTFYLHFKTCEKNVKKYARVQEIGKQLLTLSSDTDIELNKNILVNMRENEITNTIKKDPLILKYGEHLCTRYLHHKHLVNHIRQKLIQMGKLLIALHEIDASIIQLKDVLQAKKFKILIQAIHQVCGYDSSTGQYKITSLPTMLGSGIRKCAEILISIRILEDDEEERLTVEKFLKVYDLQFTNLVARPALNNMEQKKWNKQELLPLTEDIQKLNNYLNDQVTLLFESLQVKFTYDCWDKLSKCLLIKIMLFNRRRAGELERLTIEDFQKRHQVAIDSDFYRSLSPVEKIISSRFYRIIIRGKRHNPVPVLVSHKEVDVIEILLKYRTNAYVNEQNPYIFGRRENHLYASTVLRTVVYLCGAKHPELITGTKLRKQIATLSQILSLTDADMNHLAKFMGHDIKIHRDFYRLPTDAVHLAKISKLLLALNEGRINEFKGKNLDELDPDHSDLVDDDRLNETHLEYNPEEIYERERNEFNSEVNSVQNMEIASGLYDLTNKEQAEAEIDVKFPGERASVNLTFKKMRSEANKSTRSIQLKNENSFADVNCDPCNIQTKSSLLEQGMQPIVILNRITNMDLDGLLNNSNSCDVVQSEKVVHSTTKRERTYSSSSNASNDSQLLKKIFRSEKVRRRLYSSSSNSNSSTNDTPVFQKGTSNKKRILSKLTEKRTPKKYYKKKTWITPEKRAVKHNFAQYIEEKRLPSLRECSVIISRNSSLQDRTPDQLKAFINNQIKTSSKQNVIRKGWSTPERHTARRVFAESILKGNLPSLSKISDIINNETNLKNRTPAQIKA